MSFRRSPPARQARSTLEVVPDVGHVDPQLQEAVTDVPAISLAAAVVLGVLLAIAGIAALTRGRTDSRLAPAARRPNRAFRRTCRCG
jgi:hypothetical protein